MKYLLGITLVRKYLPMATWELISLQITNMIFRIIRNRQKSIVNSCFREVPHQICSRKMNLSFSHKFHINAKLNNDKRFEIPKDELITIMFCLIN